MLHELFHLDSLSQASSQGHISDLDIRYQPEPATRQAWYQAYKPSKTKVLALWSGEDTGRYVVTNGKAYCILVM